MWQERRADQFVKLPRDIPQLITAASAPRELHPGHRRHTIRPTREPAPSALRLDTWTSRIAVATFGLVLVTTSVIAALLMLNDKHLTFELFLGLPLATLVAYRAVRLSE